MTSRSFANGPLICVAGKQGRLGNRLSTCGHYVAVANNLNLPLISASINEYADYFSGPSNDLYCSYPDASTVFGNSKFQLFYELFMRVVEFYANKNKQHASAARRFLEKHPRTFTSSISTIPTPEYRAMLLGAMYRIIEAAENQNIKGAKVVVLRSKTAKANKSLSITEQIKLNFDADILIFASFNFRDPETYYSTKEPVRRFFSLVPDYESKINSVIDLCRSSSEILVGIHARRDDYKNFQGGRYYYEQSHYAQIMEHIKSLYPNKKVGFLICSDEDLDPKYFANFDVQFGAGGVIEDLYALSKCDFIVGPPSTFSGWAAYFGEKPRFILTSDRAYPQREDLEYYTPAGTTRELFGCDSIQS